MTARILNVGIKAEFDVVAARQRARQIAGMCGFGPQDQAKIATAVSELARNVYNYAGTGRVEFFFESSSQPQTLVARIEDQGPGIAALDLILSGRYQSPTGMGLGIIGARRLMDEFEISTAPGKGTVITLKKNLPREAPVMSAKQLGEIGTKLAALPADVTLSEVQLQNRELLSTLAELKARQDEMSELTRELEDTNRGVVALYAELDEKADHLRRADDMKTRFLSNMSHEFRTPLNSIRALSKLLLSRSDGDLTAEQQKQVEFIQKGADSLYELVNDLLDLAKIEAGKIDVKPATFDVPELFSALRGMLRPLLVGNSLALQFEVGPGVGLMHADEGKVSQILRNFISNALKFTEGGEIVVSAKLLPERKAVEFSVRDTGIGIAPEHQDLIFEEFSQIENRLQQRVKGTGLGLPLCRKLAGLMGGSVSVESAVGKGSTFRAVIPLHYPPQTEQTPTPELDIGADSDKPIVLIVEDHEPTLLLYGKFLAESNFFPVLARTTREADAQWKAHPPAAVVLDVLLDGEECWDWMVKIKNDIERRNVPIILCSEIDARRKGLSLGADAYFVKPLFEEEMIATLRELTGRANTEASGAESRA